MRQVGRYRQLVLQRTSPFIRNFSASQESHKGQFFFSRVRENFPVYLTVASLDEF
jgi:hypothetical protein